MILVVRLPRQAPRLRNAAALRACARLHTLLLLIHHWMLVLHTPCDAFLVEDCQRVATIFHALLVARWLAAVLAGSRVSCVGGRRATVRKISPYGSLIMPVLSSPAGSTRPVEVVCDRVLNLDNVSHDCRGIISVSAIAPFPHTVNCCSDESCRSCF